MRAVSSGVRVALQQHCCWGLPPGCMERWRIAAALELRGGGIVAAGGLREKGFLCVGGVGAARRLCGGSVKMVWEWCKGCT